MNKLLFSILLLVCFGCISIKKSQPLQPYTGIVIFTGTSCRVNVEIIGSENAEYIGKKIYVMNLEHKYQKNGLKINFNLIPSRAQNPEGCASDMVATCSNVSVLK